MRWLFADLGNELEVQKKRQIDAQIEAFWQQFAKDNKQLAESARKSDGGILYNWMQEHLHAIHPGLLWEMEFDEAKGAYVFIITAGGSHELRLLVETILKSAPKLKNWSFRAYKNPNDLSQVADSRIPGDWTDTEVFLERNEANCVDLTFVSPKFSADNEKDDFYTAMILAETVLGEEVLDKWIGNVFTRAKRKSRLKTIMRVVRPQVVKHSKTNIVDLPKAVKKMVDQIKDTLPDKPLWQIDNQSFTIDTVALDEHADDEDRPPSRLTTVTIISALTKAVQSRISFHSCAFSNFGEIFCYIKILDLESPLDHPAKYSEFEMYLDQKLREAKLGCATGSGVGLEAAFIDLMLADVPASIPILRAAAKKFRLPDRSWLLFHDIYWRDEWVGMTEFTPLPIRDDGQW